MSGPTTEQSTGQSTEQSRGMGADHSIAAEYEQARERVEDFRRDAREDPASAIYPHADEVDVRLSDVIDGVLRKPLVVTRAGEEAAVIVSVDFFNRAHAAVELLEDDASVGAPQLS